MYVSKYGKNPFLDRKKSSVKLEIRLVYNYRDNNAGAYDLCVSQLFW